MLRWGRGHVEKMATVGELKDGMSRAGNALVDKVIIACMSECVLVIHAVHDLLDE